MRKINQILLDELSLNDLDKIGEDSITHDNILDAMKEASKQAFNAARESVIKMDNHGEPKDKYDDFDSYLNEIYG